MTKLDRSLFRHALLLLLAFVHSSTSFVVVRPFWSSRKTVGAGCEQNNVVRFMQNSLLSKSPDDKKGSQVIPRELEYDRIMPGDIISFSAGEGADEISQVIVLLTGDDYSHSATVSRDAQTMVEQIPPNITKNPVENRDRFGGRKFTVSRLNGIDLELVQKSADYYFDQGQPYGNADLVWVGLLLLRQKPSVLLNPRLYQAILALLKSALLDAKKPMSEDSGKSDVRGMFCSQFVYQCYDDAGETLEIRDRTLNVMAAGAEPEDVTILDKVAELIERNELAPQPVEFLSMASKAPEPSTDDAVRELYEALREDVSVPFTFSGSLEADQVAIEQELAQAVVAFALQYADAIPAKSGGLFAKIAEPSSERERVLFALDKVRNANFVTPGDLTRIANQNAELVVSFVVKKSD